MIEITTFRERNFLNTLADLGGLEPSIERIKKGSDSRNFNEVHLLPRLIVAIERTKRRSHKEARCEHGDGTK